LYSMIDLGHIKCQLVNWLKKCVLWWWSACEMSGFDTGNVQLWS